jgi:hypothetical protein
VTDKATWLANIPDHLKPLAALILGGVLLSFIVIFHGAGIHLILHRRKRFERDLRRGRPHVIAVLLLFGWSVFLMLTLHILEFAIWALALIWMGLIPHLYDAIYFCANAYTTLGYGNVDLDPHWRNLSPIIGISGLFTMAWTTGALASVVSSHSQLLEQIEEEREKELQMHSTLRKEEWALLQKDFAAEKLQKSQAVGQAARVPFFQRHAIWKAERKAVRDLCKSTAKEIAALIRTNRKAEDKLGSGDPMGDSDNRAEV